MGLTFHFLTPSFEMVSGLLDFIPIDGRHHGNSLADYVIAAFQRFEIDKKQVFCITVDNASNNDTVS